MANLDGIEDVIGGIASYNFYQRMVAKYGQINVLFFGALILVIAIGSFIAIFAAFVNWDMSGTWSKIKPGDKLYVDDYFFDKNTARQNQFDVYRLALPVTAADIDKMKIPEWQKSKMKDQLDTTLKPKLIPKALVFWVDSMYKYKTAFCGTLIKKDSVVENSFTDKWYVIKPNFKLAEIQDSNDSVPDGYKLQQTYFIEPTWIKLTEPQPIINLNKHK